MTKKTKTTSNKNSLEDRFEFVDDAAARGNQRELQLDDAIHSIQTKPFERLALTAGAPYRLPACSIVINA